jgi:ATP-binding protein involved in chromosome partitioning
MDIIGIKEIWQIDGRTLGIIWTDLKEHRFDVVELRRQCPCAVCNDEMTGKKLLKPQEVSDGVRPTSIDSVGRYGMSIKFDDGHSTGIYSFDQLRKLASH